MKRLVDFVVQDHGGPSPFWTGERVVVICFHDVSPVLQKGPMCGLVALTMAAHKVKAPQASTDRFHPENILEYAVRKGLSKQGEMFSAHSLGEVIVNHLLLRAQVINMVSHTLLLPDLLVDVILGHSAVLVPYDADKDHSPCLSQGHRAHWCLLVGVCVVLERETLSSSLLKCCHPISTCAGYYILDEACTKDSAEILKETLDSQCMQGFLDDDQVYVFARQGKSSHLGLWSLRKLMESNQNLVEVDPQRSNPVEYVIPERGLREGLQNKVVIVTK